MNQKTKAFLSLFVANALFGFSFLFSKTALAHCEPFVLLSLRFTIAFLLMTLLWFFRVFPLHFKGKKILPLLLLGICEPCLYFICEGYGILYSSSSFAGIMIALIPVVAMLLSIPFLKEIPTLYQLFFLLFSLLGVFLASSSDGSTQVVTTLGMIFLIGAVLSAASFNLLSRATSEQFTPFERTYVMFGLGTIVFIILCFIQLKGEYLPTVAHLLTLPSFVGSVLYLSICSSLLAFYLFNYGMTYVSVAQGASFSNISTVVTVAAGVLLLHEPFSLVQFLGAVLILAGVWGVNTFIRKYPASREVKAPK